MMGVYIKGVEMPKDGEHPYWVTIHSDGIVEYNENKGQGWQTSEAVPVPPHGRLGDLDALIEKVIAKYLEHERKSELVFAAAEIKQDIVDLISDAPTIIQASEADE